MSATPVNATRTKLPGMAQCQGCGTRREWTRERARQHVKNTGHTVEFVIEDVTRYEPLTPHADDAKDTP